MRRLPASRRQPPAVTCNCCRRGSRRYTKTPFASCTATTSTQWRSHTCTSPTRWRRPSRRGRGVCLTTRPTSACWLIVARSLVSGIGCLRSRPGAGTRDLAPSSFRALRAAVPPDARVVLLDGLTVSQRRLLLYAFIDHDEVQAQETYVTRVTRRPSYNPVSQPSTAGRE